MASKQWLIWRSRTPPALHTVLLFTPLTLAGLGTEAVYSAAPPTLGAAGVLEYMYYGVAGLFTLQLLLDFTQTASTPVFFRTRVFGVLLLLPVPLPSDGVRIGAGLMLPVAIVAGRETVLLDALFTATSAVCVTGLILLDTPTHFSTFGQVVIMGPKQVGGWGYGDPPHGRL